jgi:hypothetical protein
LTEISTDGKIEGLQLIRLQNPSLAVELIPALGGKLWSLENRKLGRQFLWRQPGLSPRVLPLGGDYDENFFGGMDELLPNDIPENVNGKDLVDHGELWNTALKPRIEGESLVLEGELPITPLRYKKTLSLSGGGLQLDYCLTNLGPAPLDLLWKLHPALNVSEGCELHVPAETAQVGHPDYTSRPLPESFGWDSDPSRKVVPARGNYQEFLYLLGLDEGTCALAHRAQDWMFRLRFDPKLFSSVWVFASYAGWKNLELLVPEPCTNPHLSLLKCAADKTCLRLEAGAEVRTSVTIETGNYAALRG